MPNGAFVNVPDDITPEGMARISSQYAATPRQQIQARRDARQTATVSKRDQEDANEVADLRKGMKAKGALDTAKNNIVHGMTFGLDDVAGPGLYAGTAGAFKAIKEGDIGEIGRAYSNARTAAKLQRAEDTQEHPIAGTAGSVGGILLNPVGAETGAAKFVSKAAPYVEKVAPGAVNLARKVAASAPVKTVAKLGESAIGRGSRAGFNQGAITGLVDTGNPDDALHEGVVGGIAGGAASALLRGGQGVYRTIKNQAPAEAPRLAMERVAAMLDRSHNPVTGKAYSPGEALNEIKATDHGGGDAILADITPEGQSWASYLAKQPGLRSASEMIDKAGDRAAGAADRFNARVRKVLGIAHDTPDAHESVKGIVEARKAAGQRDYSDDVMDRQLAWNDKLDKLFKASNPAIQDAMPHAEKMVRIDGNDAQQLAFSNSVDPQNGIMKSVPSMRTMQYVTQGLDTVVQKAMREGDANLARAYSRINRTLKDGIAEANPDFAEANKVQRDAFERQSSTELGTQIIDGLKKNSRQLFDDMRKANVRPEDMKVGFADALLHLNEKSENPVKLMRRFMRSNDQRKVLAHMFGSNAKLNEFEQFMRRELRGTNTDEMIASGRQMRQNLLKEPSDGGPGETVADIAKSGIQGGAFGGPFGAVSRITREIGMRSHNLSTAAKDELANVLSGKGEGLTEGIARSKKYQEILARRTRRSATVAGKAPGGIVGGYAEQ